MRHFSFRCSQFLRTPQRVIRILRGLQTYRDERAARADPHTITSRYERDALHLRHCLAETEWQGAVAYAPCRFGGSE